MEVRVLGEVAIVDDDGVAEPVTSPSRRTIVAVLAAHVGHPVRPDVLVDALWDDPPAAADASLRSQISRLRSVLGDELAITSAGYVLRADSDVAHVDALAAWVGASTTSPAEILEAVEPMRSILDLEPFVDFAEVEALEAARARVGDQLGSLRLARARALVQVGRAGEAVVAARALVAADPLRERAWAVLAEALAADGQNAEALRAVAQAREALAEVGLEPGADLAGAESSVLAEIPRASGRGEGALPTPASSLIGRGAELAELVERLRTHRLVTLAGPGGVGKTRLAVEAGHRCSDRHEWGARLVSLEGIEDPRDVAVAVLDRLGLSAEAVEPIDRLRAAGGLDLLVVLDNCEHVVEAAAEVASALVQGGPGVVVLATSRERLAVPGEQVTVVEPLASSAAGRRLFVERAGASGAASDLTDTDTIDRIVDRVDGLPLAIEMAASQLATTTLRSLADDLDRHLADLAGATRGVPSRQRSLADLLAWTTARLDDADRALLGEVSVFAGTVTAASVQAVTGRAGVEAGLRRLVARSLLRHHDVDGASAFAMGAVVRAGAADLVADADRRAQLEASHLEHHLALARAADAGLATAAQAASVAELDRLLPDLRSALRWALLNDGEAAVALCAALGRYGRDQVRMEVLGWAAEVAASIESGEFPGAGPDASTVAGTAAQLAVLRGDLDEGRRLAELGLAVPGAGDASWVPREVLSDVALFQGLLDEAIDVASSAALPVDPNLALRALLCLLLPAVYTGDVDRADELMDRIARLDLAAPSDQAWAAFAEGEALIDSDPEVAMAALRRAVALADEVSDRYVGGVARVALCAAVARHDDPVAAVPGFEEALDHWRSQGAATHLLITLRNLPLLLRRLDLPGAAAELLGALAADETTPEWGAEGERLEAVGSWVAEVLAPEELERALGVGRQRDLSEAAVEAAAVLRGVAATG